MRRILWLAVAAMLAFAPAGQCRNQDQQKGQGSSTAPAAGTSSAAAPQESLGEAARRLREQRKAAPKATMVFTNDNLTRAPEMAAAPAGASAPASEGKAQAKGGAAPSGGMGEKAWRARFASLRHKLEQDQADLAVMQRELGELSLQNYNDPNKALAQQYSREDIKKKTADIQTRKKQIGADQQAIDDAETELRKSGGDSGWAR